MTRIVLAAALTITFIVCGCAEDPIPKLSDDLEDLDLNTRLHAVRTLRDLDDDRAIDLLAEALESDEELIDAAGEALAHKGRELRTDDKPDKVNEAVTRIMSNTHLEDESRAKAAWVLGEIGDRESIPPLKAAKSAKDAKGVATAPVRLQATQALEKLGYNTRGRAVAMDAAGEVGDRALDGTPDLEQPTVPTAEPEQEAKKAEETKEGTQEPAEQKAPSEAPAPGATEAKEKPEGTQPKAPAEEAKPAKPNSEST